MNIFMGIVCVLFGATGIFHFIFSSSEEINSNIDSDDSFNFFKLFKTKGRKIYGAALGFFMAAVGIMVMSAKV